MIYFSLDAMCLKITQDMTTEETQLSSTHEEADKRMQTRFYMKTKCPMVTIRRCVH